MAACVAALTIGAGAGLPDSLIGKVPGAFLVLTGCAAAVLMPRLILPLVISGPFIAGLIGTSLVIPALLLMTLAASASAWPRASAGQRRAASAIAVLTVWTVFAGVVLQTRGVDTVQVAIAIVYAASVGALIALGVDTRGRVVMATLAGWGLVVAHGILSTPTLVVDRTQTVWGENANGAGFVVIVGIVATASLSIGRSRLVLALALPAIAYMTVAAITTGSRGSLIAGIAAALAYGLRGPLLRGGFRATFGALAGACGALIVAGPAMSWLIANSGRDAAGSADNLDSRRLALTEALRTAADHPLVGVGLGNLASVSSVNLRSHNVLAGMAAESGLLVVALFLGLILMALRRLRSTPESFPLLVCVLVASVAIEWWGAGRTGI
ncbi:MAG: O-antigen ligase family protein, partial [Candidatus Nanopelagicales bacterium]